MGSVSITSPLIGIPPPLIANLSSGLRRKLVIAVAGFAGKTDPADATVEDLLNYFPTRYEDRSNFISIGELQPGMEAAVEIYTKISGGFQVGRNRNPRQPQLFLFEISGSDASNRFKPVVVKWFVSGKNAKSIIQYYSDRFARGTRFVAY